MIRNQNEPDLKSPGPHHRDVSRSRGELKLPTNSARSVRAALIEALKYAAIAPSASSPAQDDQFISRHQNAYLNVDLAVSRFKFRWLYSNNATYASPATEASGSQYILFYKNLSVTDISDAELFALLRINSQLRDPGAEAHVEAENGANFLSDEQYTNYIGSLFKSILPAERPADLNQVIENTADAITQFHGAILRNTISIDRFYTSSLIHIPRSLKVNMRAVVAQSGYIQSAGYSIYARRAEKADQIDIEKNIQEFLIAYPVGRYYFIPFAHEIFAPYQNKDISVSIRNGLDGVQFQLRKQYVSGQPVNDIIRGLAVTLSHRIHFAKGGMNYNLEKNDAEVELSMTMFMLYDNRPVLTSEGTYAPSVGNYLIIYAQYQANGSQFITFKERKPAWVGPITLPHTLSASMINITREGVDTDVDRSPLIVDPFCGTGTSLIDAAVRFEGARIVGFDRNPAMPCVVRDNLSFFALSTAQFNDLKTEITDIVKALEARINSSEASKLPSLDRVIGGQQAAISNSTAAKSKHNYIDDLTAAIRICLNEMSHLLGDASTDEVQRSIGEVLETGFGSDTCRYLDRNGRAAYTNIIFYVTWRAMVNGRNTLVGARDKIYKVVHDEFCQFLSELGVIAETPRDELAESFGAYSLHQGTWSPQSRISEKKLKQLSAGLIEQTEEKIAPEMGSPGNITIVRVIDSVVALECLRGAVDVLIGDPPYWFNTDIQDIHAVQKFYARFISAAVAALRPGGQMVMPVLQYSRNGRQVPFFQTRGALTRQIFSAAESSGRKVTSIVNTAADSNARVLPPFYWNSSSVLSRRILWFTIN